MAPQAHFTFAAQVEHPEQLSKTPDAVLDGTDIDTADIIIGNVASRLLTNADKLQWIQLGSAGADAYVKPGALPDRTRITTSVGAYGQAVAEHALALLLSLIKKLPEYRKMQEDHAWEDLGPVTTLADAQVLVMGAGDIGLHFAKMAHGLGAHCIAYRQHKPQELFDEYTKAFDLTITKEHLLHVLPEIDCVASFLPSTPETQGLVNKEFIDALPNRAYIVNAGRGDLIVEQDLIDALTSGDLAGAALDVTPEEPLPKEDPLWEAPHLLITPHIAGYWHLPQTRERVVSIAQRNLKSYISGKPLRNEVTRE